MTDLTRSLFSSKGMCMCMLSIKSFRPDSRSPRVVSFAKLGNNIIKSNLLDYVRLDNPG